MTHVHGFGVRRSCLVNNEKMSGRMESGSKGTNLGTLISVSILRSLSYLTPWQLFTSSSKGRDVHFNLLLSVRSSVLSTVLSSIQLFATPWTIAHQSPLPIGFSRQEYWWNGLPFPTPGDLPNLGIKPISLPSLAFTGRFFSSTPGSSVQSLSHIQLFATPWTAACQASLSITNSWSPPKHMSIESVMSSNLLILCHPLLLLPSIVPSIKVFSNESALRIRWPKYWSFSFNISLSNEHQDWSPLGWTGWITLQRKGLSRVFSNTTVQKHQFFGAQLFSQSNSHIHTWLLEKPQPWLDGPLLTK